MRKGVILYLYLYKYIYKMSDVVLFCQQRKLRMQFNIPNPRVTTISPYTNTNLTQFDLDMRRKAEILKHTGAQKRSQVGKLTKAQLFAQLVRGYGPTQKLLNQHTGKYNQSHSDFCDSSMNLVLTSSSDVPGPVRSLYLDTNIPLYKYGTPADPFSANPKENNFSFIFVSIPAASLFTNGVSQRIGVLEIFDYIPNSVSVFTMTIPYSYSASNSNPVLTVTFGGSPVLLPSPYIYNTSEANVIVISNITLYTTTGYIFEIALQFENESNAYTISADAITVALVS